MATLTKPQARARQHRRIRGKVVGSAEMPRFERNTTRRGRSAQLVDDLAGRTLAGATWLGLESFKGSKTEQASEVGKQLATQAKAAGIETCVFDRGGYLYHGRVKALADGAREGGLKF